MNRKLSLKSIIMTLGWLALLVIGIVQKRPVIAIVSALFIGLGIWAGKKNIQRAASAEKVWQEYAADKPELADVQYQIWRFSESNEFHRDIFSRILNGEFYAESYSLHMFEEAEQPLPEPGEYYVICGPDDQAYCVVRSTRITETTFGSVTPALARAEGCETVKEWKEYNSIKYENYCEKNDLEFDGSFRLFFEEFEVLQKAILPKESAVAQRIKKAQRKAEAQGTE